MKFRVTGKLKNGKPFDRVVDGPDEQTVREYAKKNGVFVKSVQIHDPTQQPSSDVKIHELPGPFKSKPVFLVLMLFSTVLYPIACAIVGTLLGGMVVSGAFARRGDMVIFISGRQQHVISVYIESILYVLFFGFFIYAFSMVVLLLCHLIFRKSPTGQ